MTPTPRLRFVERQHGYRTTDGKDIMPNMVRILQQWWAGDPDSYTDFVMQVNGEWRDVSVEKEDAR
jgi:hypothetical protein